MEKGTCNQGTQRKLVLSNERIAGLLKELLDCSEAQGISACFMCRTCSSSCPIATLEKGFDPVKLIRMCLYGLWDQLLRDPTLWLCTSCYACQERCPQGIKIADFITVLKNLAVKKGEPPPGIKAQREIITQAGRVYPLDEFDNKKRAKMGLPELPTTCTVVGRLIGAE